ncbi:hypothetical protein [Paraburkholderia sp. A3RO-2L]|uniref:hypothetical protein n=1 Tax=Paraburkholderia sp. A3RO-2L TaxID=3028376 RepID=UPI003DA8C963
MSGSVLVDAVGISKHYASSSQFSQYTGFVNVPWSTSWSYTWRFPTYGVGDSYATIDISNASIFIGLPQSTQQGNAWYGATYVGPTYIGLSDGNSYNGYVAMCSIDGSGNFAGVVMEPLSPTTPY